MRVLADLADAYSDGTLRVTVDQNVLYRWVKTDSVEPFYQRLVAAGLGAPDAGRLSDVVSCPGAESCRLAVTQSRGLGQVLTEHLSARPELVDMVSEGHIKISGCPNGCGQHHIGRSGSREACAKSPVAPCRSISCWSAAAARTTGRPFRQSGLEGARAQADGRRRSTAGALSRPPGRRRGARAFFRRVPPSMSTEALKDLAQLLPNEIGERDLIDLGENQTFNPEVMDGECSA
jgi:sulfite reductase (NADPH) hemoprotein beta-component